ncbi:stimulated by retinoic acid gene 8 protein homolog isoform 2-T2 [Morphnus guianensis]
MSRLREDPGKEPPLPSPTRVSSVHPPHGPKNPLLLMETAGDCRKTHARVNPNPLTHVQEVEPHVAKRRLAQARHRATLARLFSGLREAVLSQSDNSALKYQVLRKAKKSIQKLEQTLGSFLKMKESFSLKDGNPSSLEEVREEYVKRHFNNHSTAPALEAVSESDSTAWCLTGECEKQTLEEDGKPELIQSSETSSPDLVEFERSAFASCTSESPEDHHGLYLQITDFLKSLFFANTQFCQEEDLQFDYETVMLRCTETFDDEDF